MHWILNEIVGNIESPYHLGTCVDGRYALEVPTMSLELTMNPRTSVIATQAKALPVSYFYCMTLKSSNISQNVTQPPLGAIYEVI